ncbi:glutamate receptor U1-like [Spea bombifrons]|uniref:glutamate receptor U1-like n=1 Tax=Spea bombifrons TaxID=233779 RepID=UPI00234A63CE|nr:glutamate receptor U1-like [Spea bombifrons]
MKKLITMLAVGAVLSLGYVDSEETKGSLHKEKERAKRQVQKTLTITTILEQPFAMMSGSEMEGFCLDLLTELSQSVGFNYTINVVKDGRYGAKDQDGNWNGMVGEIVKKEADLAVAPLTITSARENVISFTKPFLQTGISILLRKDPSFESSTLFGFLSPFSNETWIGILIAYLITSLCLFLVGRLSPCEWNELSSEENKLTFLNSLWFGVGAFTLQGAEPHPKSVSARIIAVIWWVFSITLLAAYIASFAAFLNIGNEQTTNIQTFEDLVKQRKLEFGTINSSSTFQFFKNNKNPTYRMIYEQMEKNKDRVLVKSFSEGVRRVRETNYAFLGESVMQDLVVAQHCDLARAPEVIAGRGYGIAASLDSPLIKPLTVAILEQIESGNVDYLREKWWENTCSSKGSGGWTPVKPRMLGGIFLILGIGLALGIIVSLMELVCKAKNNANQQKKSCCSAFSEEISQRFKTRKETEESTEKAKP